MRRQYKRASRRIRAGAVLVCVAIVAAGCSSTIHDVDQIGGVDTLSLDAKQRMMLVGNRGGISPKRVTCTEPMPDAIVAQAAVFAGSANVNNPGGVSGGGGLSGGSSESAASIGFNNQTIQMLRDGYFRLCEAYLNGALTKEQYQHMIMNADTFMVVVSALQILGSNPSAPAVTISAGGVGASTTPGTANAPGGTQVNITPPTGGNQIQTLPTPVAVSPEAARQATIIVNSYLQYRANLLRMTHQDDKASAKRDTQFQPE